MDHVVVDVEIVEDPTLVGWENTDKLGMGCGIVYEYRTNKFLCYSATSIEQFRRRLAEADVITGFNHWKFDLPVIFGIPNRDSDNTIKSLLKPGVQINDILQRVWATPGRERNGWKLGQIAEGTLGRSKLGDGQSAPGWLKDGDWARVVSYCIDDVSLTRDLHDHIEREGWIQSSLHGQRINIAKFNHA